MAATVLTIAHCGYTASPSSLVTVGSRSNRRLSSFALLVPGLRQTNQRQANASWRKSCMGSDACQERNSKGNMGSSSRITA
jgi:hypothetical protein